MVKHDIDHSVGKIASQMAFGNGSVWFQSSQGSDEPKRTHLPPADLRCYFTYRMINNIYYLYSQRHAKDNPEVTANED